jgi:hypothetical protein
MDYVPMNYVAQPEDSINELDLIPHVGASDKWAIEWGYRWRPGGGGENERKSLDELAVARINKNTSLWFGAQGIPNDPRINGTSLGNGIKSAEYLVKNMKFIIKKLPEWTRVTGEGYSYLKAEYNTAIRYRLAFSFYDDVISNIGGLMKDIPGCTQCAEVTLIPKTQQRMAIQFLNDQLFKSTPTWLLSKRIFALTGSEDVYDATIDAASKLQNTVLKSVFQIDRVNSLLKNEMFDPMNAYSFSDLLNDLKTPIWSELLTRKPIDKSRRALQKLYILNLATLLNVNYYPEHIGLSIRSIGYFDFEIYSILKGHFRNLAKEIKKALPFAKNSLTNLHLEDCLEQINIILTDMKSKI